MLVKRVVNKNRTLERVMWSTKHSGKCRSQEWGMMRVIGKLEVDRKRGGSRGFQREGAELQGWEKAEGSDGTGSEMRAEIESWVNVGWSVAGERRFNRNKLKKTAKEATRGADYDSLFSYSETEQNAGSKQRDEYKIIAKLSQDGALWVVPSQQYLTC